MVNHCRENLLNSILFLTKSQSYKCDSYLLVVAETLEDRIKMLHCIFRDNEKKKHAYSIKKIWGKQVSGINPINLILPPTRKKVAYLFFCIQSNSILGNGTLCSSLTGEFSFINFHAFRRHF